MKRVEVKLNLEAVAPLLDAIKEAADDLRPELAVASRAPDAEPEFADNWKQELLAGQNSDVRELLGLFGREFFADGTIAIDSNNSDSLLRGCSALRIQILTRWLQGIPADLLEDEDVPPEAIADEVRVPFASYTFLDQVQKIILEHLDPTAAEA